MIEGRSGPRWPRAGGPGETGCTRQGIGQSRQFVRVGVPFINDRGLQISKGLTCQAEGPH